MPEQAPILIIGGGIGGLTLGLALARRGLASHILEQRTEFSELGAGIQLGPNATRILSRLGLLDNLKSRAFAPENISIGNGRTGERLTTLPLKPNIEARFGSPYLTLLRADLQAVLLNRARSEDLITITTGFRLDRIGRGRLLIIHIFLLIWAPRPRQSVHIARRFMYMTRIWVRSIRTRRPVITIPETKKPPEPVAAIIFNPLHG